MVRDLIIMSAPLAVLIAFAACMAYVGRQSRKLKEVQKHRPHSPDSGTDPVEAARSRMEADAVRPNTQGLHF